MTAMPFCVSILLALLGKQAPHPGPEERCPIPVGERFQTITFEQMFEVERGGELVYEVVMREKVHSLDSECNVQTHLDRRVQGEVPLESLVPILRQLGSRDPLDLVGRGVARPLNPRRMYQPAHHRRVGPTI